MGTRPGHEYFSQPRLASQRRYEALRAYFVEGASAEEVAGRFGYRRGSVERLVHDHRAGRLPALFAASRPGPKRQPRKERARALALELRRGGRSLEGIVAALAAAGTPLSRTALWEVLREAGLARLERPAPAAPAPPGPAPKVRVLAERDWPAGGWLASEHAGLFLLLPELVALDLPALVAAAGYPGTSQLTALHSILALLSLKLSGRRRRSHVSDVVHDRSLGLFCGLSVLPKAWHLTTYSYRTERRQQEALLSALLPRLRASGLVGGESFNLDFHAIMSFGEGEILEEHYVSRRSQRTRSVLTFFAEDGEEHALVYANADLAKREQAREVVHFCEFYEQAAGEPPGLLVFDQRLTTYAQLLELDQRGIGFITLRKRGKKLLSELAALPAERWQKVRLERPGKQRDVTVSESTLGIEGHRFRQIAVRGLGREQPTLFLTNQHQTKPKELIERYARRWGIENHLAEQIRAFHLDSLASQVPLSVDFDTTLTVLADAAYRRLARSLRAHAQATPETLYRHFIDTKGELHFAPAHVEVRLRRRTYTPTLLEAGYATRRIQVPWWGGRTLSFAFPA
jgi:transposase